MIFSDDLYYFHVYTYFCFHPTEEDLGPKPVQLWEAKAEHQHEPLELGPGRSQAEREEQDASPSNSQQSTQEWQQQQEQDLWAGERSELKILLAESKTPSRGLQSDGLFFFFN